MLTRLVFCFGLLLASIASAEDRTLVSTLFFEVGRADLTAEHRLALDALKTQYPTAQFTYYFEGDHDPSPFDRITPNASKRVNERLAETRWQVAAQYLGVPALGLVRYTGNTEVRVYVATSRPGSGGGGTGTGTGGSANATNAALADSIAALRRELADLYSRRYGADDEAGRRGATAPPETILAVARFEELHERSDKWVDARWWESSVGLELGILRVQPERPGRPTGATLSVSNGSPAYHALDISTRLDLFRLGNRRIGITPALRWYDWDIRIHYGDDRETRTSFVNRSLPLYLLGLDLDAAPWDGATMRLRYAGTGARVHAAQRHLVSYDQYDLRFDQNLAPRWRVELQAVYDERFEKSLCYYGLWIAHGWRMLLGEFSIRGGYVEQLAANQATIQNIEDPIGTVSVGFTWERTRRFRY